jgi:EAL domain-containing protein (putative c-di-GMP-specific phosphodiesterase class I)
VGSPELIAAVDRALRETAADPASLVFELTETAAIANLEEATILAHELRTRGCRFALDDFGVGFISFAYLKHIPFDYLKIDGDFIRGLAVNPIDELVVDAIVGIARRMGKMTVAEFVTDAKTAQWLHDSGVDFAQGFEIGRPRPFVELLEHMPCHGN